MSNKIVGSTSIVTPGQVHEAYLQIEKGLKSSQQNHFDGMTKLLKNNVFESTVKEYFKKRDEIISKNFEATNIIVQIEASQRNYNVEKDIRELVPLRKKGGLFNHVDSDIVNLFGDVNFTPNKPVVGKVYSLKNQMSHSGILTEARQLGVYAKYDIVEALFFANKLAKSEVLDRKESSLIIYLSNIISNVHYFLNVRRSHNDEIEIYVQDSNFTGGRIIGDSVLFSC